MLLLIIILVVNDVLIDEMDERIISTTMTYIMLK
jgi:hypothetical protein